ncbi:MAG: proprotein convertase P-domain-containing protein [Planctomycetota bacterium]|jgi:subtilisin-like proprotein convertase family protein
MDAPNALQQIVSIVLIVVGVSFPVFAGPVYIYSGEFDLPIPANPDDTRGWMADAIIEITDQFTVSELDIRINITHTSAFDLQIFLQSPAGTTLCLNMYNPFDEYFEGENYTQTIFDDEAETAIEQAEPPFTGRFRPKAIDAGNLLEVFNDQDAYGLWRLQIYDAFYADTGSLDSFELIITTPEPATSILLLLGTGLITLLNPRRR